MKTALELYNEFLTIDPYSSSHTGSYEIIDEPNDFQEYFNEKLEEIASYKESLASGECTDVTHLEKLLKDKADMDVFVSFFHNKSNAGILVKYNEAIFDANPRDPWWLSAIPILYFDDIDEGNALFAMNFFNAHEVITK